MESYIKIKSNFASATYWAILEGQQLAYYDGINPERQTVKGNFSVKGAKVSKVTDISKGIRHGIQLVTSKGTFTFDCMDANVCSVWFSVCLRASNSHLDEDEQKAQLQKHKKVLGLDTMESFGKSDIVKSYKRLCLKEHPDKGGNVELFNQIKEAYNALIARQTIIDELNSSQIIHYEAMIEKASGAGIGLIVAEDKIRKRVLVTRTDEKIKVVGLTEEAEGEIRPGDALIGIDNDDCSEWHLSRVRARLNEHRVPLGAVVHFTFERLIPVSPENSPKPDDGDGSYSPARENSYGGSPRKENSSTNFTSSSDPYDTSSVATPPRKDAAEDNGVRSSPYPSSASQKESVFRAAATFPSMNDIDEEEYTPNGTGNNFGDSSSSVFGATPVKEPASSSRIDTSSTEVERLTLLNEKLMKEISELREANESIKAELTDKHERHIYQLNEKLVGAYREIKNMATEIATLKYQLNSRR